MVHMPGGRHLCLSLMAGEVDAMFDTFPGPLPHTKADLGREESTAAQRSQWRKQLLDFLACRSHRTTITNIAAESGTCSHKKAGGSMANLH